MNSEKRISGKDIAAYMGINPATLSRLKKKMS
jgi:DNA-binding Xre family transcriptional regulator